MLDTTTLLHAMNGIHDGDVVMAGALYFSPRSDHGSRAKRVLTLALAAALLLALGTAAYAVGLSIHQTRQAELQERLAIAENAVSGYTEYEASEASAVQLVSSLQQGDYQQVYFSVSPVTEAEARSFIFGNLEIGFVVIAGNEEIPEEAWLDWDLTGLLSRSYASAVFYDDGHAAEHLIRVSSQTGLPAENGDQSAVTFEVIDPDWSRPLILEHSYDPETQSLLLQTGVYRKRIDFSRPVYFSVRCVDLAAMLVPGPEGTAPSYTPTAYETGRPVYLRDYGTVTLEAADMEFLSLELPSPIRCVNEENGGGCEILSVRLSANSVEWRLTHDGIDLVFRSRSAETYETELQWYRFYDRLMSDSYLTLADGSTLALSGSHSVPYEDGVLTLFSEWDGTIDIRQVKSITILGAAHEFHAA